MVFFINLLNRKTVPQLEVEARIVSTVIDRKVLKTTGTTSIGNRPIGGTAVRKLYSRFYIVVISAFAFSSLHFRLAPIMAVLAEGVPFVLVLAESMGTAPALGSQLRRTQRRRDI